MFEQINLYTLGPVWHLVVNDTVILVLNVITSECITGVILLVNDTVILLYLLYKI